MAEASEKRILVVDDEPDVRHFLAACIQDAGFMVETARDGQDALEKIKRELPDLMTLDMVMPRKSGAELIRTLRENEAWASLPVIVITAHARNEFAGEEVKRLKSAAAGMKPRRIISKPVTPEKIVDTICDILGVTPEPVAVADHSLTRDELDLLKMIRESDPGRLDQLKDFLKNV